MATRNRLKIANGTVAVVALVSLSTLEYVPDTIALDDERTGYHAITITGRARELIPLEYAPGKGLWAARGYDLYFLPEGERAFHHRARLYVGFGSQLAGYSRLLRHVFNLMELVEVRQQLDGTVFAFAGGHVFRSPDEGRRFARVADMNHFGLGEGRGVMPQGITAEPSGSIYWGEYWRNPGLDRVRVWRSKDKGSTWSAAAEFGPGNVRHVHAVQYDPFAGVVWVATGDNSPGCKIGYLHRDSDAFTSIGEGAQMWRAVALLFTGDHVYWGMDGKEAGSSDMSIWRWSRRTGELTEVGGLHEQAYYAAQSDRWLVISTGAEDTDVAALVGSTDGTGDSWQTLATWTRPSRSQQGTVRMVSGSDGSLYLGLNNLEPYRNTLLKVSLPRTAR